MIIKGVQQVRNIRQNFNILTLKRRRNFSLVSNGLVFHVDPSSPSCYSGSGTSCNDLTLINGIGTLSGITFTVDKAFHMSSVMASVSFTRLYTNVPNAHTLMTVVEIPYHGPGFYPPIFHTMNGALGGIGLYSYQDDLTTWGIGNAIGEDTGDLFDDMYGTTGSTLAPQKVIATSVINSTEMILYINGIRARVSSPRGGGIVNAQAQIAFGYNPEALWQTYPGIKIYNGLIYNRALSDAEVLQNYNFLKFKYKL